MNQAEAVAAVLAEVLPAPVEVASVERLAGGASADLAAVDAVDATGVAHALVMRTSGGQPTGGLRAGIPAETAALRSAETAGVPVPSVVAAFVGDPVLGDGYLMTRREGQALPAKLLRDPEFAGLREVLVADAGRALAGIHRASPDGLARLGPRDQLDALAALHRSFGHANPVFDLALQWLADRLPDPVRDAVVHGDFRMGNLLCDADGLVAVLDWELVHLGDPDEDLGWFCAPAWRFGGAGPAGGLGSREELLSAYAEASGRTVDPERLRWWEVLATIKWGVICQYQASRVLTGGERSIEHALIGRRVTEVELDLLLLMGADVDGTSADLHADPWPSADDLVRVTAAQLREDVLPELEGRARFLVRVAINALETVQREATLGADVEAIEAEVSDGASREQLLRWVLARLAIDNPAYPSIADVPPTS
ncbi:phosphotransferase family protein [Nocardioides humilatus]|uniref:Phosphotransferase family protein n=1 Tax=Nocardioides humilatus TaxID=2607660 RepID=A0A5B1LF78_9ACTN|nr:phosphotransferase [Nocardioides humilatus]KAA1419302.1 phosphotransferase family protein [Nocardioides humilatus]